MTTAVVHVPGTPYRIDSERAREMGRISARRRPRKLALEDVEAAFAPLTDLDSAMHRLDRLGIWLAAGMVPGAAGTAAVRSVEVWVRAHESKLTEQVVGQLRGRLEALEQRAAQARAERR